MKKSDPVEDFGSFQEDFGSFQEDFGSFQEDFGSFQKDFGSFRKEFGSFQEVFGSFQKVFGFFREHLWSFQQAAVFRGTAVLFGTKWRRGIQPAGFQYYLAQSIGRGGGRRGEEKSGPHRRNLATPTPEGGEQPLTEVRENCKC